MRDPAVAAELRCANIALSHPTALGWLFGRIGAIAPPGRDEMVAAIGLVTLVVAVREFGILRFSLPSLNYLVPREWLRLGSYRGALAYGLATGIGFLTRAPYGSYHILVLWQTLSRDATGAALLGVVYGMGRATPVILSALPDRARASRLGTAAGSLLGRDGYVHLGNAALLASVGGFLVAAALRA